MLFKNEIEDKIDRARRELRKAEKLFGDQTEKLQKASGRAAEFLKRLETASTIYEDTIAETGEARPELMQAVSDIERQRDQNAATVRGLERNLQKMVAEMGRLRQEIADCEVADAQRIISEQIRPWNKAAAALADVLDVIDQACGRLIGTDLEYDFGKIPIESASGLPQLSVRHLPRLFLKESFGGSGQPKRAGHDAYFFTQKLLAFERRIQFGPEAVFQPPRKTIQELEFELSQARAALAEAEATLKNLTQQMDKLIPPDKRLLQHRTNLEEDNLQTNLNAAQKTADELQSQIAKLEETIQANKSAENQ